MNTTVFATLCQTAAELHQCTRAIGLMPMEKLEKMGGETIRCDLFESFKHIHEFFKHLPGVNKAVLGVGGGLEMSSFVVTEMLAERVGDDPSWTIVSADGKSEEELNDLYREFLGSKEKRGALFVRTIQPIRERTTPNIHKQVVYFEKDGEGNISPFVLDSLGVDKGLTEDEYGFKLHIDYFLEGVHFVRMRLGMGYAGPVHGCSSTRLHLSIGCDAIAFVDGAALIEMRKTPTFSLLEFFQKQDVKTLDQEKYCGRYELFKSKKSHLAKVLYDKVVEKYTHSVGGAKLIFVEKLPDKMMVAAQSRKGFSDYRFPPGMIVDGKNTLAIRIDNYLRTTQLLHGIQEGMRQLDLRLRVIELRLKRPKDVQDLRTAISAIPREPGGVFVPMLRIEPSGHVRGQLKYVREGDEMPERGFTRYLDACRAFGWALPEVLKTSSRVEEEK